LSRAEVLRRFSPSVSSRGAPSDRIDVLITTDVLSEGVDLHDASVVVHLDMPWNPARLEQRVGRLRRVGSPHDRIAVYFVRPPAPAERLLEVERRLRTKVAVAAHVVGISDTILPHIGADVPTCTASSPVERLYTALSAWRHSDTLDIGETPVVAAVASERDAAIACLRTGDQATLLGIVDGRITEDADVVLSLVRACQGCDAPVDNRSAAVAERLIERWVSRCGVASAIGAPNLHVASARRALLRRIDAIATRVSRHQRPTLAPLMRVARSAATVTLSAGAEHVLDELARAPLTDEAWLQAVGEFATRHTSRRHEPHLLALLFLRRGGD
jgi:hypothetical protein